MASNEIWLDSGAMVSMIPEQDIFLGYFDGQTTTNSVTVLDINFNFTGNFQLLADLYVGCTLDIYNESDVLVDTCMIRSNAATTISVINLNSAVITQLDLIRGDTRTTEHYGIIRHFGAPVPATNASNPQLLSDTWVGLASAVTIPTTSTDIKQINVGASGTRNFIYQFKGAETTSNASLTTFANAFPWLYYALGSKTIDSVTTVEGAETSPGRGAVWDVTVADDEIYQKNGDTLHRIHSGNLCPPAQGMSGDATPALIRETYSSSAADLFTYTISENNGEDLPSFALEYVLRKPNSFASSATDADKEDVYCKIYPGCVVGNLSMTAQAGQEIECSVDILPKNTFVAPAGYQTNNGQTDITHFVNFGTRRGSIESGSTEYAADVMEPLMRPFFFSDGTVELFGEEFIQLENFTLTIDNGIQQRRFIGKHDKRSQYAFATQRTYSLSFTGLVTNADLFDYFRQEHAFALTPNGTADTAEVKLRFDKENGESLDLRFRDYHVQDVDFQLTNDNGPITVTWTVTPLSMDDCELVTYWPLQG